MQHLTTRRLLTGNKMVINKTKYGNYSAKTPSGNVVINPKARFHKTADGKIRKIKLTVKGVPNVLKIKTMARRKEQIRRLRRMNSV